MEQNSTSQEIPHILLKSKVYYSVHFDTNECPELPWTQS
jgi:hypothetical protein